MKKFMALLLVAALSLAMAGCGSRTPDNAPDNAQVSEVQDAPVLSITPEPMPEEAPEPGPRAARGVRIGISLTISCYMVLYSDEMERYFESLKTDTEYYSITNLDARGDQVRQNDQVDEFIAQGVDVMIINLVQSSSANRITEKAKAAGIPVVYINGEPSEDDMKAWEKICYVGTDRRQQGTCQGEIIRDLPDNGDADGDGVVRYVMIMGDPKDIDAQYRTDFSIKALTDAGIRVENLFQQNGDWEQSKGQELTASALAQFGDAIDVIFCNNDGMAMGAIQAIEAAGRVVGDDIYLVGVDAIPEAIDAISACFMTGTVFNDHISQAHAAVDAALRYAYGEKNDTYIRVDFVKVAG